MTALRGHLLSCHVLFLCDEALRYILINNDGGVSMYRYKSIKTELTKGLGATATTEKDYISDWSPNNVKTLVLGSNGAIISYHMSGKKYPNKTVFVKYKNELAEDMNVFRTDRGKLIGVLKTLIDGRVFSSIEEIIFCVEGYPTELLNVDMDMKSLITGTVTLETRFPRMSKVFMVNTSLPALWDKLKDENRDELWFPLIEEKSVPLKVVYSQLEKSWFRGSALRPQFYGFDEDYLSARFEARKKKYEDDLKTNEVREIKVKKAMSKITTEFPVTVNLLSKCMEFETLANEIFKKSTIVDKAEWAYLLETKKFRSLVRADLSLDKVKEWKRVDIPTLKWAVIEYDMSDSVKTMIDNLEELIRGYTGVDKLVGDGSKEVDALNLSESLDRLKDFALTVANRQYLITYAVLAKYLVRNTKAYAVEGWSRLEYTGSFKYTKTGVEYANPHVDGCAGEVFGRIGDSIEADKFPISLRLKASNEILTSLKRFVTS